jgi:hypothetical protein
MRNHSKPMILVAGVALAGVGSGVARAQSTDGYHTYQNFPVVVDSGSYTQRFVLRNSDPANSVQLDAIYFPGNGTSQAQPIACPDVTIPAGGQSVFASLRELCPALPAGSQFGFLSLAESDGANRPFAGFSRVSNSAGNGFAVESFPGHTFTGANTVVTGIRRLAATGSTPAFQTNCFIAALGESGAGEWDYLGAGDPVGATVVGPYEVAYTVFDSAGVWLGSNTVDVGQGNLVRLLDVFAAAGVPAGNYNDASVRFQMFGDGQPALMTFCTVQDNSSFGADFRIGKQERPNDANSVGVVQDDHTRRNTSESADTPTSYEFARPFTLLAGASRHNTHVMYFHHPDRVFCELVDPGTGVRALPAYGLEMRLLEQSVVVAGGDGVTGFDSIYLGDKPARNNGASARYTVEVENSVPLAVDKPYRLHCQSGSGHTRGDIIEYNLPSEKF